MLTQEKFAPMMAYWDKNLVCRFANEAYIDWFGYSPSEIVNKMTISELLGPVYHLNERFIEGALAGNVQTFTRLLKASNGVERNVLSAYYPDSRDGITEGFFAYVIDVTDMTTSELEKAVHDIQLMVDANKHTVNKDHGTEVNVTMYEVAQTLKKQVCNKFPGLNKLAQQHCISVSKLKRDFKQYYHMSPYAFFHDLKMIFAENYLKQHKCSKKELAAMLDFSNPASFYSAFKKFRIAHSRPELSDNLSE